MSLKLDVHGIILTVFTCSRIGAQDPRLNCATIHQATIHPDLCLHPVFFICKLTIDETLLTLTIPAAFTSVKLFFPRRELLKQTVRHTIPMEISAQVQKEKRLSRIIWSQYFRRQIGASAVPPLEGNSIGLFSWDVGSGLLSFSSVCCACNLRPMYYYEIRIDGESGILINVNEHTHRGQISPNTSALRHIALWAYSALRT